VGPPSLRSSPLHSPPSAPHRRCTPQRRSRFASAFRSLRSFTSSLHSSTHPINGAPLLTHHIHTLPTASHNFIYQFIYALHNFIYSVAQFHLSNAPATTLYRRSRQYYFSRLLQPVVLVIIPIFLAILLRRCSIASRHRRPLLRHHIPLPLIHRFPP